MIPVFVLSYNNIQAFNPNVRDFSEVSFYLVDNGNQNVELFKDLNYFKSPFNVGCAGGWNLICDIAFDYLQLDKIIITQDDMRYSQEELIELYEDCNSNTLSGLLAPFFEFSCFAIHKETWNKVGRFDENCIYVYSEDVDYKQRCSLNNITVNSLFLEPKNRNASASIKNDPSIDRILYNREYINLKWGASLHPSKIARADCQPPFTFKTPFKTEGNFPLDFIPFSSRITKHYPTCEDFPSKEVYSIFKKSEKVIK